MSSVAASLYKVPIGIIRVVLGRLRAVSLSFLSGMDTANLTAAWLSFAATAVGLGGLISQASAINDQLDPYHATRTAEYLGIWFQRQPGFPWWRIAKPPPEGPVIAARMADGFCGVNAVHIARIPAVPPGKAGWSTILAMFNHDRPALLSDAATAARSVDAAEKGGAAAVRSATSADSSRSELARTSAASASASWIHLERKALKRYQAHACIVISRTTLITMLVTTNGRPVFQYSDATGFRAGYASYCGQWYITWPIGQEAIVKFAAHDSIGSTEVLPRSFAQRVDRCGQMVAGVVSAPASGFAVGFCGRKDAGRYRLEHAAKGFQGAHSGRHLYNMFGGKAYTVDFLHARAVAAESEPEPDGEVEADADADAAAVVLELPSKDGGGAKGAKVRMLVPAREEDILRRALDCLPWTSLSWSLHRGMRDVLAAYGRAVMDAHRPALAALLQRTVAEQPDAFRARGWDPAFVRENMGPMAASAVLAGAGNSGDSVRVVTDIVRVHVGDGWDVARLDEVVFWRRPDVKEIKGELDAQAVVALTKLFVLEWSQEFDYQLYHHLPINLYFG
ncbi:Vacuolar inheritance and morphology protein [Hypoxylon texense]